MKRLTALVLVLVLMISAVPVSAEETVKVVVNGSMVFFDQPPVIIDGRTLVPVRAVAEKLGAFVSWNGETQTVSVSLDQIGVALAVGNKNMAVTNLGTNQLAYVAELDVPPQNINGRTLLPIRPVVEAFGCSVAWDGATSTVLIYTGDYDPAKARTTIVIGE